MASDSPQALLRQTISIHLPGQLQFLRVVRQSVLDLCASADTPAAWAAQLELVVDEACTNIIEHSYQNAQDNPGLKIDLSLFPDRIEVLIHDAGAGFPFGNISPIPPDRYLQEGRCRGLGMHIIHSFVDQATYECGLPVGNILRLVKKLPAGASHS